MIALRIRLKGLDSLIAKNKKAIEVLESGKLTDRIAKKTERRAKYRAPRDTGRLVKGIKVIKTGKNSFKLMCDVKNDRGDNYAIFLEGGTRYIRIGTPQNPRAIISPYRSARRGGSGKTAYLPFLRWAIWRTMQERDKLFKKVVMACYR